MCGTDNDSAAAPAPHPASKANLPSSSPYSQVQDYLSNTQRYQIIESTLREGEQFANAFFTREHKVKIATMLSEFGCQYIELTSPVSSQASYDDCKYICSLGLKAKILTHVRCNMEDAKRAVECGVDGVDLVIGTSSFLREYSHGKSMAMIKQTHVPFPDTSGWHCYTPVPNNRNSKGVEVRFSSEDSFRSDLVDILALYQAVDKAGVNRVGIADTVGGATPRMVYDLVRTLRGVVGCDIECHFHDDTGCSVANAVTALEGGATHVDTSVLGIGERNGITPLGALMARMVVSAPEYTKATFDLPRLKDIEEYVASVVEINIPFNNPVTGFCAFTHKAGIHAKAILANPSTYEIIDPALFGLTRYVNITSRITGWNAVKGRITQLGLDGPGGFETDAQIKEVTAKIKQLADIRPLAIDDADSIIHAYHLQLTGNGKQQETAA
ncbi:homocitrate synthase mitochondrial [Fusarium tjaetaba]|uniref:homocitrate synthase n=1 Tax=Fusarium tjaetaba TaxID=1567544 RepID=A0A8H5R4D0_9HYPO|nr:homocitrate synthase mitochondrial [Fusarium tjaetaba]KAF5627896.1 homocitrate synthase mitochondrial [Fusarium tjaetaba]